MNTFIANDIEIENYDAENFDRYTYTKQELDPSDYDFMTFDEFLANEYDGCDGDINEEDARAKYAEEFDEWAEKHLNYEEIYNVPMMNALRFFPSFVKFDGDEKVSPNTCLIYDNDEKCWAVGMTGGGMDLSPNLLETFVLLGKGVPAELAETIDAEWCIISLGKERGELVLSEIAKALDKKGDNLKNRASKIFDELKK